MALRIRMLTIRSQSVYPVRSYERGGLPLLLQGYSRAGHAPSGGGRAPGCACGGLLAACGGVHGQSDVHALTHAAFGISCFTSVRAAGVCPCVCCMRCIALRRNTLPLSVTTRGRVAHASRKNERRHACRRLKPGSCAASAVSHTRTLMRNVDGCTITATVCIPLRPRQHPQGLARVGLGHHEAQIDRLAG